METNTKYSPFTSKGYPFKKDWSSYNTYDMGRAFFSDGFVDKTHSFSVFDNQNLFNKIVLKDEPLFYKKREIPVTIYSAADENEIVNTFKKLEIDYDEIAIFFFIQNNNIKAKINLGDSLLKLSNFETEIEMESKTFDFSSEEFQSLLTNLSAKNLLSFFNKNNLLFNENVENISGLFNIKLKGYWSKDKEGKIKITNANLGETVYFHLETLGIEDNTKIVLQLEEDDAALNDQDKLFKKLNKGALAEKNINKTVVIKNKKAIVSLYLDELWADMIKDDVGKEIELIWKAYSKTFEKIVESDELNVGYSKRHLYLKPAYQNYSFPELLTKDGETLIFSISDFAKQEVIDHLIEPAGKLAENYRYNLAVRVLKSGKITTNINQVFERKKAIYTYNVFTNEGKEVTLKQASNFGFKNKYVNNGKLVTTKGISQVDYFSNIGLKNNALKAATEITQIWDIFDLAKVLFQDDLSEIPVGYLGNPVSFAYAMLNEAIIKPTIQGIKNDWNKGLEEDFETIYKPKGVEACKNFSKNRNINSPIKFMDIFTPTLQKLLKNEFMNIEEIKQYNLKLRENGFDVFVNPLHTIFYKFEKNKYDLDDDAFINCIFINDKLINQ